MEIKCNFAEVQLFIIVKILHFSRKKSWYLLCLRMVSLFFWHTGLLHAIHSLLLSLDIKNFQYTLHILYCFYFMQFCSSEWTRLLRSQYLFVLKLQCRDVKVEFMSRYYFWEACVVLYYGKFGTFERSGYLLECTNLYLVSIRRFVMRSGLDFLVWEKEKLWTVVWIFLNYLLVNYGCGWEKFLFSW